MMKIPFTVDQFFEVFARYNEGVWPMQIILNLLAIAIIVILFRTRNDGNRIITAILSFFWAWMAITYHFISFTDINPAAWLFGSVFLAGALCFAWIGVLRYIHDLFFISLCVVIITDFPLYDQICRHYFSHQEAPP
jgi:hypothetical protein